MFQEKEMYFLSKIEKVNCQKVIIPKMIGEILTDNQYDIIERI